MNEQPSGTTLVDELGHHPPTVTTNNAPVLATPSGHFSTGPPLEAPPSSVTTRPPSRRSPWVRVAVFSACSLFVGMGVGYALGLPGTSSMRDRRDEALAELDAVDAQLDEVEQTLSSTQGELTATLDELSTVKSDLTRSSGDLTAANSELAGLRDDLQANLTALEELRVDLGDMTDSRDTCRKAAGDGMALVDEWNDVFGDILAWLAAPVGSQEEARLDDHVYDQLGDMDRAYRALADDVEACRRS